MLCWANNWVKPCREAPTVSDKMDATIGWGRGLQNYTKSARELGMRYLSLLLFTERNGAVNQPSLFDPRVMEQNLITVF